MAGTGKKVGSSHWDRLRRPAVEHGPKARQPPGTALLRISRKVQTLSG
jgi:hypothetical protein